MKVTVIIGDNSMHYAYVCVNVHLEYVCVV